MAPGSDSGSARTFRVLIHLFGLAGGNRGNKRSVRVLLGLAALFIVGLLSAGAPAHAYPLDGGATTAADTSLSSATTDATITSDKADYAPGETVTITGLGWPAQDTITIQTDDSIGRTWSDTGQATSDDNGTFTYVFALPNRFVASYTTTATDANGLTATTTFTDAQPFAASLQGQQCVLDVSHNCTGVGDGAWTSSQLACSPTPCTGWRELDPIPMRVLLQHGPVTNQKITVDFDHTKTSGSSVFQGIENLTNFTAGTGVSFASGPTLTSSSGDTWTYTFFVNVTTTSDTDVEFTAKLSAGAHYFTGSSLAMGGTPSLGNVQIHVPAAKPGSPDLKLTKTVDSLSASPGNTLTYTLTYDNLNPRHDSSPGQPATGVEIIDTLPSNVTYASGCTVATNCVVFSSGELRWTLGTLAPGAAGTRTFQVTINSGVSNGTVLTNNGLIQSAENDFFSADNAASASTTVAAVTSTTTTVTSSLNPSTYGDSVTFTATVSPTPNGGTVTFTDGATTLCSNVAVNTTTGQATCATSVLTATGSPHTITATYSGTGGASGYGGSNGTVVQTVTKKALTISGAVANNKVYDGTTAATVNFGGASLVGVVSGDTVTINSSAYVANFNDVNVGTSKPVTVTGVSLSGADAGNYSVSQPSGLSADITKAALDIYAVTDTKVYDGTTTSSGVPTVSGLKSGDTVTGKTQAFDSKNAGSRTLAVTAYTVNDGNSGNNYAVTTHTATGTITKAALDIYAVTDTKVYDGTTTSSGVPTVSGLKSGDTVTGVTQAFDSPNVGTRTLSVTGYTVNDGNSGNNYSVTTHTAAGTINPRPGVVAYIGQTVFVTSGSSSTNAQVTLTASVADPDGTVSVANATVSFKDLITGKVLATGVKVSPVTGNPATGTANVVLTLSSGQYGAQMYLIEVSLNGAYENTQQTSAPSGSAPYVAAHPVVTVMIPSTINSMQGTAGITKLATAAGTYGDAASAHYGLGLKYTNKGTNPQGQIQLILERSDGTYYIKSNSISSVAFSNPVGGVNKDVTVYTKASIYKVSSSGVLTSIDGNVTLRVDAHEGCTTSPTCTSTSDDKIGFTVLSSKNSALYYSNNWVYDSGTLSWRTVPQDVGPGVSAVVIN